MQTIVGMVGQRSAWMTLKPVRPNMRLASKLVSIIAYIGIPGWQHKCMEICPHFIITDRDIITSTYVLLGINCNMLTFYGNISCHTRYPNCQKKTLFSGLQAKSNYKLCCTPYNHLCIFGVQFVFCGVHFRDRGTRHFHFCMMKRFLKLQFCPYLIKYIKTHFLTQVRSILRFFIIDKLNHTIH